MPYSAGRSGGDQEVLAALTFVGFMLLILLVVGMMREIVVLRGEIAAFADLIKHPPPPTYVGRDLPDRLRESLEEIGLTSDHLVVAFASPSCGPSSQMLENLAEALADGQLHEDDVVVVMATDRGRVDTEMSQGIPNVIHDVDGRLAHAAEVRTTPALVWVSLSQGVALEHHYGGSVEWMMQRLQAASLSAAS